MYGISWFQCTEILNDKPFVTDNTVYIQYTNDHRLHKAVLKFFKKKFYKNWIHDKLGYILGYFTKNKDDNIVLISNMDEYDEDAYMKDNRYTNDMKVDFLKRNFLNYEFMFKYISEYVRETNIPWASLYDDEKSIRTMLGKEMQRKLKKRIYKRIDQNHN